MRGTIIIILCISFLALAFNNGEKKSGNMLSCDNKVNINPDYMVVNLDYNHDLTSIHHLSNEELVNLIDSLFDADSVPQMVLFELQLQLESRLHPQEEDTMPHNHPTYPAEELYGEWNTSTTNPYHFRKPVLDSTTVIALSNELIGQKYTAPVKGVVTSNFGFRDGRAHNGIDLDLVTGDSVVAAFDGVVRISRRHGGYGHVIVIRHDNGLETTYAHLSRRKVVPGDRVLSGQLIGLGGNTGKSTGSHLHFEVRFVGYPINPKSIINFKQHCLLSDSVTIKPLSRGYAIFPYGQEFHTVQRGDYLFKICQLYGVNIKDICLWNGIRRNSTLRVGQKIRIEPLPNSNNQLSSL